MEKIKENKISNALRKKGRLAYNPVVITYKGNIPNKFSSSELKKELRKAAYNNLKGILGKEAVSRKMVNRLVNAAFTDALAVQRRRAKGEIVNRSEKLTKKLEGTRFSQIISRVSYQILNNKRLLMILNPGFDVDYTLKSINTTLEEFLNEENWNGKVFTNGRGEKYEYHWTYTGNLFTRIN